MRQKNINDTGPVTSDSDSRKLTDVLQLFNAERRNEKDLVIGKNSNATLKPAAAGAGKDSKSYFTREFRVKMNVIITSPRFEAIIVIFIFFNTICLAMEFNGMSDNYKKALDNSNHMFTVIFILEFVLKVMALTPKGYVKSRWNIFDGMVVTISIIDLIIELSTSTENGDFTIIRSLRLFRILKLANSWPTMRLLLSAIARSINALANLTFILGIILYMFAVVGTQLFADQYKPNNFPSGEVPEWNFNNFTSSFLVIFRVLCGEWIELLYECMLVTGLWAAFFFIAALIIGNFLILNLFLALLLGSFAEQNVEEDLKRKSKKKWTNIGEKLSKLRTRRKGTTIAPMFTAAIAAAKAAGGTSANSLPQTSGLGSGSKFSTVRWKKWLVERWLSLRRVSAQVNSNKYFNHVIIVFIIASSFTLVFEDVHLQRNAKLQKALQIVNIVFCVLFTCEFTVKLFAMGFITYMKEGWNVLDFVILLASIISLLSMSSTSNIKSARSVRAVRTFRAMRPLRAVSRWQGIKIVVNSLLKALPSIANVFLVCLMFWLIFSILGVQFFSGKFFKCVNENGDRMAASIIPNKSACLQHNLTWKNSPVNFDNSLNGFLALFQVATFEGWIEVMRDAVDATQIHMQPIKQHNRLAYVYFVVFIIIGSFVILNLFISVMIDNFHALKKQQDEQGSLSNTILTQRQKEWLATVRKSLMKKPRKMIQRPANYYVGRLFDILCSAPFELFIISLIFVNAFVMTFEHYQQPMEYTHILRTSNILFTAIFCTEILLKVIAFRQYFYVNIWNVFDLVIITMSVLEVVLMSYGIDIHAAPNLFHVFRVLRIGRLLRFLNGAKGLRRVLWVLVNSSASVIHMGVLLFLVIFIYAIIGMTNFGHIEKTGVLNEIVNFETCGSSMLLLLRVATSAGWNEVLDGLMIQPPHCQHDEFHSTCPTIWLSVTYFVSYILISFLIVVNLHIAVIVDNFDEAYQTEENVVTDEDLDMFYSLWQHYDPQASQFISFDDVSLLVGTLGPPLGIPLPNNLAVHNLDLLLNAEDKVHCTNLLQALIKYFYSRNPDGNQDAECDKLINSKRLAQFPILMKHAPKTTTKQRLKREKSAIVIQRHYRSYRQLKREHSAVVIQRYFRTYLIKRRVYSVIIIQRYYRSYRRCKSRTLNYK